MDKQLRQASYRVMSTIKRLRVAKKLCIEADLEAQMSLSDAIFQLEEAHKNLRYAADLGSQKKFVPQVIIRRHPSRVGRVN